MQQQARHTRRAMQQQRRLWGKAARRQRQQQARSNPTGAWGRRASAHGHDATAARSRVAALGGLGCGQCVQGNGQCLASTWALMCWRCNARARAHQPLARPLCPPPPPCVHADTSANVAHNVVRLWCCVQGGQAPGVQLPCCASAGAEAKQGRPPGWRRREGVLLTARGPRRAHACRGAGVRAAQLVQRPLRMVSVAHAGCWPLLLLAAAVLARRWWQGGSRTLRCMACRLQPPPPLPPLRAAPLGPGLSGGRKEGRMTRQRAPCG